MCILKMSLASINKTRMANKHVALHISLPLQLFGILLVEVSPGLGGLFHIQGIDFFLGLVDTTNEIPHEQIIAYICLYCASLVDLFVDQSDFGANLLDITDMFLDIGLKLVDFICNFLQFAGMPVTYVTANDCP